MREFCVPIFIVLNHCINIAIKRTLAAYAKILMCNSIVQEDREFNKLAGASSK